MNLKRVVPVCAFSLLTATAALGDTPSKRARAKEAMKEVVKEEVANAKHSLVESMVGTKVHVALIKHLPGADGTRITVDVQDVNVTLSGEVKDRVSYKLAAEIARSVEGVKAVANHCKLADDAPVKDSLEARAKDTILLGEVKVRLVQASRDAATKVVVDAADGTVSLRGAVPNQEAKDLLIKTAKDVPGVRDVMDLLATP